MSYPERIVPDGTEPGIVASHVKRYAFAEPWCRGKHVLDVACGVGYGTELLGRSAERVVGVDIDDETVFYARSRYAAANVEYVVADAAALPFADATFDVVCSFETIEHVADRDAYLTEVTRVLRAGGTYVVSTPRARRTTLQPNNPFHRVELSRQDFEALLRRFFGVVDVFGQHRVQTRRHRLLQRADVLGLRRRLPVSRAAAVLTGTASTACATLDDIAIDRESAHRAPVLVAVCTGTRR